MADPTVPPPSGACFFFTLPAELRNLIYEYALTERNGLFSNCHNPAVLTSSPDGTTSANQLKSVCQQLHAETRGLDLRCNVVNFSARCSEFHSVVQQLVQLLDTHGSSQHAAQIWTTLSVSDTPEIDHPSLAIWSNVHTLLDCCRPHPNAHIELRIPALDIFSQGGLAFLYGCALSDVIRGTEHCKKLLGGIDAHTERIAAARRGKDLGALNLQNLKIFPPQNASDIREQLIKLGWWTNPSGLIRRNGQVDLWLQVIQGWYANGI